MITKELLDRINELARKKRAEGLTEEEQIEQKKLHELYLKNIRSQIVETLESAGFKPKIKHDGACGCEHCAHDEKHDPDKLLH